MITVKVDTVGFRDLAGRFRSNTPEHSGSFRDELRGLLRDLVEQAQDDAPRRTGALADSIAGRIRHNGGTKFEGSVEIGVPYGPFVTGGTRPHLILPRRGRFLRFVGRGGGVVYARSVRHPGTKANPFLAEAAKRVDLDRRVRRIAGRVVTDLTG